MTFFVEFFGVIDPCVRENGLSFGLAVGRVDVILIVWFLLIDIVVGLVLRLGQAGGIVVVKTAGIERNLASSVNFVVDAEEEVAAASAVDVNLGSLGRPGGVVITLRFRIAALVGSRLIRIATGIVTS